MSTIQVTGKKTVIPDELSGSKAPAVVLGVDSFGNTNQDVLDEYRIADQGVEVIEKKVLNKNALLRGTYLQYAVLPWWLETLKEDGIECTAEEPEEAHRLKEERLAATLDYILTVPEGFDLVCGDVTVQGKGVLEVKTDFYHNDKCKPDWMIQVHLQMMCSNLPWGIVLVMTQKGKLVTYAFHRDDLLCQQILDKAREFWRFFDDGRDYPPQPVKSEPVAVTYAGKTGDNLDLEVVTTDYMKAKAEAKHWNKIAKDNQDILEMHMDSIDAQILNVGSYQIKSVTTQKPKRTMVEVPGEFIDSPSFSVKEVTTDE